MLLPSLVLGTQDAQASKSAPRTWFMFGDEERMALEVIYGEIKVTTYRPMYAYAVKEIVKPRALALGRRLEMLQ